MSSVDWCSQNNSFLLSSQCVCGPDFSLSPIKSRPLCTTVDIFLSLAALDNLIGCYCRGPLSLYTTSEGVGEVDPGRVRVQPPNLRVRLFTTVFGWRQNLSLSDEQATNKHSHQAHSQQPQTDNCLKKKKRRENATRDSSSSPYVKDTKRIKKCYLQSEIFFFSCSRCIFVWMKISFCDSEIWGTLVCLLAVWR